MTYVEMETTRALHAKARRRRLIEAMTLQAAAGSAEVVMDERERYVVARGLVSGDPYVYGAETGDIIAWFRDKASAEARAAALNDREREVEDTK